MYKIYADNTLIYDSTSDEYKIAKGLITLETNKSGSFVFSLYPDHFFYNEFIRLKTVITVYKSEKIVFRGRILNDVSDYWNNKVITCEGELGFLQDSIIRPFSFSGTPEALFEKFIQEHNAQVDEFKQFKIGTVTVVDPNNYITRSNSGYESALSNLTSRLIEDSLGGYFYITHGEDGTDPIPTINYLADFTKVSTQKIEFGSNLKDYVKTVKADDIATAIIPLGHEIDDGDDSTENPKLTISSVNGGKDYVYSVEGVALYGWIFKVVSWDDVTDPSNLKSKANAYVNEAIKQNITIELNAIDLHLLDKSIESFSVCDYIHAISPPHNFDSVLLCNKQTLDLLKPDNDTVVLGYTYSSFTEKNSKISNTVSTIGNIQSSVKSLSNRVSVLKTTVSDTEKDANEALENYRDVSSLLGSVSGDLEIVAGVVTENARAIATNAANIATNASEITLLKDGKSDNDHNHDDRYFTREFLTQVFSNLGAELPEEGTSGEWSYRKWPSGCVECWGTFTLGEISAKLHDLDFGWYLSDPQIQIPLPEKLFTTAPLVFGDIMPATGKCLRIRFPYSTSINNVYFRLLGGVNDFPNTGTVVHLYVRSK